MPTQTEKIKPGTVQETLMLKIRMMEMMGFKMGMMKFVQIDVK